MRLKILETIGIKHPCKLCIVRPSCKGNVFDKPGREVLVKDCCNPILDYYSVTLKRRKKYRKLFKKYLKVDWCEGCSEWRTEKILWKDSGLRNLGCLKCNGVKELRY